MNIVGLVTEHNPFHNGHLYHVDKAREECNATYVVSVMSGHFLQRGEPALFNKWARAKMAVAGGVDMVVELPTAFSVRSASAFAHGAVSLLNSMGVITHICFGSESGNLDDLWPAARLLADEPPEFRDLLGQFLARGLPYPAARSSAIEQHFTGGSHGTLSAGLYETPNNILGIEYLKSLLVTGSPIEPVTIKRFSAGYHDRFIDNANRISSATSIREELLASGRLTDKIKSVVPGATYLGMKEETIQGRGPVFLKSYEQILFYLLRTLSPERLACLLDVTEGLENRILAASHTAVSLDDLLDRVKTKRYTWTRIQRIMTYILLNFTKDLAGSFDAAGPAYVRILALSAAGRSLLKKVKKKASVPVIIRTSSYLRGNDETALMLKFDVQATDIYTLLCPGNPPAPRGLDCVIMPFAAK